MSPAGYDCGVLNLLPAPTAPLYYRPDSSSWCGSIIRDDDRQLDRWHLFVSVMANSCGIDSWVFNNQIVHAVSNTGPTGPYVNESVVLGAFASNARVVRAPPPDGRYLLFHVGCGAAAVPPITACENGTTLWMGSSSSGDAMPPVAQARPIPKTPLRVATATSVASEMAELNPVANVAAGPATRPIAATGITAEAGSIGSAGCDSHQPGLGCGCTDFATRVLVADSPGGPWADVELFDAPDWYSTADNPTPYIHPDGECASAPGRS
jgi:hypothetical protein